MPIRPPHLRKHPRGAALPWLVAGLILLWCASGATAQHERYYPVRPLAITERSGEIGFESLYTSEEQKRDGSDSLKMSNTSFQEYLLYRLNGYVYHPRFLDFRTQIKLGLLQQSIERTGGLDNDSFGSNTALYGYDIYVNLFKDHPLSALLYANRDRAAVMELFTDRELIDTEGWGGVLNWKQGPFPMDLSVSHNHVREWGADSISETFYDVLEYGIRNSWRDRMNTDLRYRLVDYEQNFQASNRLVDIDRSTNLRSHDLSLINTFYLNPKHTSYLHSTARYFRQSGDQNHETINWQERLQLRHTQNLSTYYLANLLENRFSERTVRTWRGEAGLDHQLYKSLRSHFDVHGRWIDYDTAREDLTGVTARFDYRKQTPMGYLTAGFGQTYEWINRSGESSDRPVIGESLVLRDGVTVFLSQPQVDEHSIEVLSSDRTITYVADFDYEVVTTGERTGLRLRAGGRLADGDSVLVDYATRIDQIDYLTSNRDYYIRHEFNKEREQRNALERWLQGLALYYRRRELRALNTPDNSNLTILELTDWAAGMDYEMRWARLNAEYERYRSNFSNYNQLGVRLEGFRRLNDQVRLGWHTGWMHVSYLDDMIDTDYSNSLYGGLSLDGHMAQSGYWTVEGRARKETGQIEETLVGLIGKMGWRWRRLKVEAGGRIEQRKRFESTRDRMQVFLQVSREFGRHEVPR